MHMKRNLTIAALAAMIGVPALGSTINANASEVPFYDKTPAVSNPSKIHVTGHTRQGINFKVDGDPQPQLAGYGSPLERQMDHSNQNNYFNNSQSSTNPLPQTGEVNNQADPIIASIITGSLGIGVAGLATLKKYNSKFSTEKVSSNKPSVSNGNNDFNNNLDNIVNNIIKCVNKNNNYNKSIKIN